MASTKQQSAMTIALKKAVDTLMELGGTIVTEDAVERGDKFTIPHYMDEVQAAEYLLQQAEERKQVVDVYRMFPYRAKDGAVAAYKAIQKAFGTVLHKGRDGFFGPEPPAYLDVEVGHGQTIQVPWGELVVPAIPGCKLTLHSLEDAELGECFGIVGQVQRRYRPAVEALFMLILEELQTGSIYRGKAIDGGFNFLDLSRVDGKTVVYAQEVLEQLERDVLGPIRYRKVLDEANVELKAAVLLHGDYGVGKTLFGYLAAQEAVAHGLTFIQVRPSRDTLEDALRTARQYSPAVLFVEDVDTLASGDQTRDAVSVILEQFDGVRAKGAEVMGILTTNHPELIHKGMIRPGRIDAVIEITSPDAQGVIRLMQALVGPELLDPEITDEDWAKVGEAGAGYIPAFIDQARRRAVKYAVLRTQGQLGKENGRITAADMIQGLESLRPHLALMSGASEETASRTVDAQLKELVSDEVQRVLVETVSPQLLRGQ